LFRGLLVVIRAWTTRRLLWLWFFAYACALTSAFFWPVSPKRNYVECPRLLLPAGTIEMRDLAKARRELAKATPHRETQWLPFLSARSLIVRGQPIGDVEMWFSRSAWKDVSGLEQIFVDEYEDNPAKFQDLCQALPNLHIWHLALNVGRMASVVFLLLATLILEGAVLQQVQATFAVPQSRTYPRFAWPHLLIPLATGTVGIVCASWVARSFGADFWATASVQVFAWGTWSAFAFQVLSLPPVPWRRGRAARVASNPHSATARWGAWSGAVLALAITVCCSIFIARPYVLESFLLGELPWMNAAFLLIGLALTAATVVLASTFCVLLNETGASPILSMQDAEKRRIDHGVLPTRFERRLGGLRRRSWAPLWLWHIKAMHSGNPDLLAAVLIRIVAPIAVVLLCQRFFPFRTFATAFVVLFLGVGWIFALSHAFSTWWQRRKAFSVQLLYPWTRRQMTRAAFAAFALDTLGILAVLCAVLYAAFVACDAPLGWYVGTNVLLRAAVGIAVAGLLVAMGGLWLLTLRHRLLASFLAVIGVLLLILALVLGGSLVLRTGEALGTVALPFGLLAGLLGLLAWRRWMRSEWGLNES
jgi:hypothetical protein